MPLFLFYFLAQRSYSNVWYLVIHKACSFDLFSSKYVSSVTCWTSCQALGLQRWAQCSSSPRRDWPRCRHQTNDASREERSAPADCTRGCGVLTGSTSSATGGQKGLGDHTERHRDEQVFVRWNSTNINTVDALRSPTKQVLLSSQQPQAGVTVLILQ